MTAPPQREPRLWVLTLDELTTVYARFVHIAPVDGSRAGVELDVMRAEWEAMGRPASLRVTLELAP